MYQLFLDMDLDPQVTPKFLYPEKCISCGHCAIGCPTGAKWDTRSLIAQAHKKGARPLPGLRQDKQILMPFISQQDGYILSPYMDYLSFFFHKKWRMPMKGLASIMIKLADEEVGTVEKHKVEKQMTALDQVRMERAIAQSREILVRMGVPEEKQFLGTLNAGHPGGMLPLTEKEKDSLHNPSLPDNLYIADATILPGSMGNPPILTIMALSKKIVKTILLQKQ